MDNHAKGDWKVVKNVTAPITNLDNCIMIDCDGAPICIITDNWIPKGMNEANADFILKACTEFEDLKKELEDLKSRSVSWSVQDFAYRAKEIGGEYDETKFEDALHRMIREHDATIGITWDTIDFYLVLHCRK